jgi:hypothetical protein
MTAFDATSVTPPILADDARTSEFSLARHISQPWC